MSVTTQKTKQDLSTLRNLRIEKLKKLRKIGINPYPSTSNKTYTNLYIKDNFEQLENKEVFVTGRIMSWREHGKLIFARIQDGSGEIQLFFRFDNLAEQTNSKTQELGWNDFGLLDIGDVVEAKGTIVKTRTGEISILVKGLKILTKSIRPLPDKWHGIKDKDLRFRRRYLDLTMNSDVRKMFERKAQFWKIHREFLESKGFIGLDVPILEHTTGGADAKPFVTHHNFLDEKLYMRISPELHLKRLIGGGYEKVYAIGPNFRNEGLDDEHLQEYMAIEWYWAYANYKDNMNLARELFTYIAKNLYGKTQFSTRGHTFDLEDDWKEIEYAKVIYDKLGIDIFKDSDEKMLKVLHTHKVDIPKDSNRLRLIDNLWKIIRKTISGPAFLINEPAFMSPLAKSKDDNPEVTERYHIIIAGSELANGYSELNDPLVQLDRMLEQQRLREAGDEEAQMLDIDFVEMLEYGMPTVTGHGHSERLFWYFEDVTAREGTIFPLLKYKLSPSTKKIYSDILTYIERNKKKKSK